MSRKSRFFRRFAIVVASMQVVAFVGASVLEAATVANQKVASYSVDAAQSHGRPIHDPGTCPACQLLTAHARRSDVATIALPSLDVASTTQSAEVAHPESAPRTGFSSRAPPSP